MLRPANPPRTARASVAMLGSARRTGPEAMFKKQPPPEPPLARRFTDAACYATSIGPGLRIKGELIGAESVELEGSFEGSLAVQGLCHLHERARVSGRIAAGDVLVEGEVEGRIFARGKVELSATARVRAEIRAHAVAIAEGSFFDGRIRMDGAEAPVPHTSFREKRRARRAKAKAAAGNPGSRAHSLEPDDEH